MNTRKPGVLYFQTSYSSVDAILLQLDLPVSRRVLYNVRVAFKAIRFLPIKTFLYLSFSDTVHFCSSVVIFL